MSLIARDRLIIGVSAASCVAVPVTLLWPQQPELHEQPALMTTALPAVSLILTGAATTTPLFNAERSPAPPAAAGDLAAAGGSEPVAAPAPALVGIAMGRGGAIVLLKPANGETVQASVGDEVDGWRIVAIARDHATAERGGNRIDLTFDFTNRSGVTDPQAATANPANQSETPVPVPPGRPPQ